MPRYKFQLETLLDLRRDARTERQQRLADALRAEDVLVEQQANCERELIGLQTAQRSAATERHLDVTRMLETQRYELNIKSQLAGLQQKIEQVRQEAERRRQALVAADLEVKSLERLDQRHREEFARQESRREQREIDDLASQAVARTRFHTHPTSASN